MLFLDTSETSEALPANGGVQTPNVLEKGILSAVEYILAMIFILAHVIY